MINPSDLPAPVVPINKPVHTHAALGALTQVQPPTSPVSLYTPIGKRTHCGP